MGSSSVADWVRSTFGADPDQSGAANAAVPLPVEPPVPIEPVPESGVRVIVRTAESVAEKGVEAAEAVGEGIAIGAAAVGLAVGAAIMTWSSKTAPPWMDEINPETGQPYKDENEWKAVKERRAKQQRGGGRQPAPGPNVDPLEPDAPPQAPRCENSFPSIPICSETLNGWNSMDEAAKAQPEYSRAIRSNVTTMQEYTGIPGGENSHVTYYDAEGRKLFTLIKKACCQDTEAGPVLNWTWVAA